MLRHGGSIDTLPTGSPGKVGLLELGFANTGERTELVRHYQKSPLQIMRPLYYDPVRPDLPFTYLMSTGGGIVQGDRLRTDLSFGPASSAHITTSAHTKVYKMDHDYAVAQVNIDVGPGAYVEYLPDPLIPFAGARLYQRTRVTLDETATLIAGETLYAGRLARDERHQYDALALDFEVRRPGGQIVALDRVRLCPGQADGGGTAGLAILGDRDLLSMLYVLTPAMPAAELADLLYQELTPRFSDELLIGISVLPGDHGVWLRVVGDDTTALAQANTAAWSLVHRLLTGRPAATIRKG